MIKTTYILSLAFMLSSTFASEAQSFKNGQNDVNIGIGFGNTLTYYGGASVIPPLSISVDHGITDAISLGGYLAYTGAHLSLSGTEWCNHNFGYYNYTDTYSWSDFVIGFRGAYHFAKFIPVDKLDVYAGLMIGFDIEHSSYSTTANCPDHTYVNGVGTSAAVFSAYGGARYRFNDKFGIFGELGYGIAILNLGLNIKF